MAPESNPRLEERPYFREYTRRGRPLEVRTGINRKRQLNLWDPDGIRVEFMERTTFDGSLHPAPTTAPLPANLR